MRKLDVPEKYLPDPCKGDLLLSKAKLKGGVKASGSIKAPDSGYRFIYVDELIQNSALNKKVVDHIGTWGIILMMNGAADGSGYGGKGYNDGGQRSDIESIMMISEDYPVQLTLPKGKECQAEQASEALTKAWETAVTKTAADTTTTTPAPTANPKEPSLVDMLSAVDGFDFDRLLDMGVFGHLTPYKATDFLDEQDVDIFDLQF